MNAVDFASSAAVAIHTNRETDLFANPHKAIRRGLAEMLGRLGAADVANLSRLERLASDLGDLLDYCERHLEQEEEIVRPACGTRVRLDIFDRAHPSHLHMMTELRALTRALLDTQPYYRATMAHALYLDFGVFAADCLHHMIEEERVLLPLMRRALDDDELLEIRDRMFCSLEPAELVQSARRLLPAISPTEQRELTLSMLERAPTAMVASALESARLELGDAYAALMAMVTAERPVS